MSNDKWIDADKNPPNYNGYYLTYDLNSCLHEKREILWYSTYNNQWSKDGDQFHPQYWQHLPSPHTKQQPQ